MLFCVLLLTLDKRSTTPGKLNPNNRSISRGKFLSKTPQCNAKPLADVVEREVTYAEIFSPVVETFEQENNVFHPAHHVQPQSNPPALTEPVIAVETMKEREAKPNTQQPQPVPAEEEEVVASINETWKEVTGPEDVNTPPRRLFLSPFKYFSPAEVVNHNNNQNNNNDTAATEAAPEMIMQPLQLQLETEEVVVESVNVMQTPRKAEEAEEEDKADKVSVATVMMTPNTSHKRAVSVSSVRRPVPVPPSTPSQLPLQPLQTTQSLPVSTTKTTRSKTPTSIRKSLYPDGRTALETSLHQEGQIRTYHHQGTPSAAANARLNRTVGRNNKPRDEFANLFAKTTTTTGSSNMSGFNMDDDSRPSIGTIKSQWEFMRTNFFNNSGEELEWLMVSKRSGAYAYAHKKNEDGEDKYFKYLYEIEYCELKLKFFVGNTAKLPSLIAELASYYPTLLATPNNEIAIEQVTRVHESIDLYMQTHSNDDILAPFSKRFSTLMTTMLEEKEEKYKIARKARDLHQSLPQEIFSLQQRLITARKESEDALKTMEKWSKREVETLDYNVVMRAEEEAFMYTEQSANMEALYTMRSYLPINLMDLSVIEFQQVYKQEGGLISLELAQELKSNKLLHWLITHPDDILYANFLSGEYKACFENLEGLDLMEMRALSLVLPMKFELDPDARKAEWRKRFFARLKLLVSQYHHEKVKSTWNAEKQCRNLVELPSLKPDQVRRAVYYYRTKEQSDTKMKSYDEKLALLKKKQTWFIKAETEAKESKEEYDIVLKEMRDPDFIALYGNEQLTSVKEIAKNEWKSAEQRKKALQQDVHRLQKAILEAPVNREQFIAMENELKVFLLQDQGIDWEVKGQAPIVIEGVFEAVKTLEKRIKPAAKFMSAEQEAAERKLELANMKKQIITTNQNHEEVIVTAIAATDSNETVDAELLDTMAAVVVTLSDDSEETIPSTNIHSSTNVNVNAMIAAANAGNNTTNGEDLVANTSSKGMRRNSILSVTNPHLIGTLNKMFANLGPNGNANATGTNGGSRPMSSRRASIATSSLPNTTNNTNNNTNSNDNEGPKEIKKSKSKLLQVNLILCFV